MLLLGADGFAGSHLREAATRAGLRVVGTSRIGEGAELACDLLEPDSVQRAVAETNPELVVNMAGWASVKGSCGRPLTSDPDPANLTRLASLLRDLEARQAEAGQFRRSSPTTPPIPSSLARAGTFGWRPRSAHSTSCSGSPG
jgi:nucleoside-diphosphate-sugar epimerase